MASPTARTLERLRRAGYLPAVVERWIPRVNIRKDLFGIIDVVAIKAANPILAVQTTSLANLPARIAKARACPALPLWFAAGGTFELHGWVCRDGRWHVKIVALQAEDLAPVIIQAAPRKRQRSRWRAGDLFGPDI
jgi:hypothetical protein